MYDFIEAHQLNILLVLGGICGMNAIFVLFSRFLTVKRKIALILFELNAMILLWSDRYAYIYRGDMSAAGYAMVRISNFLVFVTTITILYTINLYLEDIIGHEAGVKEPLIRFKFVNALVVLGVFLVILSQFTGYYYWIDEFNVYHRGAHFAVGYIIPSIINFIQLSVVLQYYKKMSRGVRVSLLLFVVLPFLVSLLQIRLYGLSLTNVALALVAILVYLLSLIDLNNSVEDKNRMRIKKLKDREANTFLMFEQVSASLVSAFDAKGLYTKGHSERVAKYAEMIAESLGKNDDECRRVYCAAILHDAGKIGLNEELLNKKEELSPEEKKEMESHVIIGSDILSGITDAPFLKDCARSHHEKYDGTGYPDGLKGERIPEIARIVAVADCYDHLTSAEYYREALPQSVVREEIMKASGSRFDPVFADAMLRIIDSDPEYRLQEKGESIHSGLESNLKCGIYRTSHSKGIPIVSSLTRVSLKCKPDRTVENAFSMPSMIIYDSLDGRVHDNKRAIGVYKYLEYGEIWFDSHFISNNARKIMLINEAEDDERPDVFKGDEPACFELLLSRYKDHIKICIKSEAGTSEIVMSLPDSSRFSYMSLTGENCILEDITVEENISPVGENDIPRISEEISFIDRIESDIPNVQIDEQRSESTNSFIVKNGTRLTFFTRSLPTADLVWHCPYIVLFGSDDGKVGGKGYKEYALIKINGEVTGSDEYADNTLTMKREENFAGWEKWKQLNKDGYECKVYFRKKGNKIITVTDNLGVYISNVTAVKEMSGKVCAAITGDQIALTDIRVI